MYAGKLYYFKTCTSTNNPAFCHEHFDEPNFEAELQTRRGFRKLIQLKPDRVPTIFNLKPKSNMVKLLKEDNFRLESVQ